MSHERELAALRQREAQLRGEMKTRTELRDTKNRVKQLERGLDESRIARFGRAVSKGAKMAGQGMERASIQYEKAQKSRQPTRKKKRRVGPQQEYNIFGF